MNINQSGEGRIEMTLSTLGETMSKGNAMHLNDSYPTEFYISDVGYLVLKQDCFECGRVTQFMLSPEQTKVFFNLLPDLMLEQTQKWTGLFDPPIHGDDNV
jgi:hypothetical protein